MAHYIPVTKDEQQKMLGCIGQPSIDALLKKQVPEALWLKEPLALPDGASEMKVWEAMKSMAAKNHVFRSVFRGAGAYRHYIPAFVKDLAGKEVFQTAYTPYQPELSQGILQSIFEFQTMICQLTGMDAANASVYDGASAAAEATAMCRQGKRRKVLMAASAPPQILETIQTYSWGADQPVETIPVGQAGTLDLEALEKALTDEVSCLYLQQPNYYGLLEPAREIADLLHSKGVRLILGVHPFAQAIYQSAGECGADIAVGEGQPLGLPMAFGGPYLGFMATREDLVRRLPGRIVGQTRDQQDRRAFVLTLQAREQHIRREKATSSLCSNQAHCALVAGAYLAAMGPEGLREVARQCHAKAHYAAEKISAIPGFEMAFSGPFFHEFVTSCPVSIEAVLSTLEYEDMLGGLPLKGALEGHLLWCFTEVNTKEEIDQLAEVLKGVTSNGSDI